MAALNALGVANAVVLLALALLAVAAGLFAGFCQLRPLLVPSLFCVECEKILAVVASARRRIASFALL